MKPWKIVLLVIAFIVVIIGLSYGFGWIGVHQTKTIGKAQKNAEREVFEVTQSRVDGIRRDASNLYTQYQLADTEEKKEAIKIAVRAKFADVDLDLINEQPIRQFIHNCKYNP